MYTKGDPRGLGWIGRLWLTCILLTLCIKWISGFPESSVHKESASNAGDSGWIPGLGRSAGEGIGCPLQYSWASLVAQLTKNPPAMWETWVQSLGWEDPLKKGKVTHASILAWRIPWTVQSMGFQRVRRDWATCTFTFIKWINNENISPVPGYSQCRDQTCISCISCSGRQNLYPCTMWEAHCNNNILYCTRSSMQCSVVTWIRRKYKKRQDVCIRIADSHCCLVETNNIVRQHSPIKTKKKKSAIARG